MKRFFFLLMFIPVFWGCEPKQKALIEYVDPFIGTTRDGNLLPGPLCPFGMILPSPVNHGFKKPDATNYIFGKESMNGIAITNMRSVGCSNYGSILLMPVLNDVDFNNYQTNYANEKAAVGYYSVDLNDSMINVEITSSIRSSFMKIHYPKGKVNLLIDLSRRCSGDTAFFIHKVSNNEIEGYKSDGQFCSAGDSIHHRVYFVIRTDVEAVSSGIRTDTTSIDTSINEAKGEDIGAYFSYHFDQAKEVNVQVAISYVSIKNARENLEQEIGNKSFDNIRKEAEQAWEKLLSRIKVTGDNEVYKKMFYTAIYHTMQHPNVLNDVNGEYPAMGSHKIMKVKEGDTRYTVFSLWDTYRTLHPFMTLVYPEIQAQMSRSLMDMYKENGWLPQWELVSRETHVMVGDPSTIVLADSYLKGIPYDHPDTILKAMIHNAEEHYAMPQWGYDDVLHIRRSILPYNKNKGWIPYDCKANNNNRHWANVATTLEYNLADWNIAQMAKKQGKDDIYQKYFERSMGHKNLFNPTTGFFQQRWENGKWVEPFNHFAGRWPPQVASDKVYDMPWPYSGGPGYCEGMAWHYNFFVPHNIVGLIDLMGGEKPFVERLQKIFDSAYYEATNEPDIAFPFLFNYVKGEEWRTQKTVHHLIHHEYGIGTDGIPGNDDTGTMSAWLLFSMMGFFPDCPGNLDYQLCAPVFDKIEITLNPDFYKGKTFVIKRNKTSKENIYIKNIKLNGSDHLKYSINHSEIVNGGEIEFELK